MRQQPTGESGAEDKPLATPRISVKRGIKRFGDDGFNEVANEMEQ